MFKNVRFLVTFAEAIMADESGAGIVEYALITAAMAAVGIAGYLVVKPMITQSFTDISTNLQVR